MSAEEAGPFYAMLRDDIAGLSGTLPTLFCSAEEPSGTIVDHWAFASAAYLDSSLPSLFKERLFIHLSRFCDARFALPRHLGFLARLGRPAGDAEGQGLTIDQVVRLLRRPVPDGPALEHLYRQGRADRFTTGLPQPDSEEEQRLFDALAAVLVAPARARQAQEAVRRQVGERSFEPLMAFLAFVRAAHFWAETHPDLHGETALPVLAARHPALASLLAVSDADPGASAARLRRALGDGDAALQGGEDRLHQFGEASQDALWIRDADTLQFRYLTPAFETIYGVGRDEALAGDDYRNWLELILPEDRPRAAAAIDKVRAGEHVTVEYRIRRPGDGEVRWVRNTDFPMAGPGGQVVLIGGISEDITDARSGQQRLEENEERLRSAVEIGGVGLWDWNVATNEIHWSDEHFRMEGYAVGEITPTYDAWASRVHPDDRQATEGALHRAMATGVEYLREFRVVHPDGSVHWLHGRGRFFYDEGGRPVRMIGAMVDTTERREMEERQKILVAELQHRTRNLMGVVRAMADRTAQTSTDLTEFRERFRSRLASLSRVQGLLSRLHEHDRVTFDDLLRTELAAMGAGERAMLDGPPGIRLRSSTVQTLAMALHELATNALKYGALGQAAGELVVGWWTEPAGDGGRPWLHIDWRERGVTMPPPGAATAVGTGQGRELIEQALPYQLSARTSYALTPDGVHCTIAIPVSASAAETNEHG